MKKVLQFLSDWWPVILLTACLVALFNIDKILS